MIEYLYAEIEDGMKVMIAPKPVKEKSEPIVLKRETFEDLRNELKERKKDQSDFRIPKTPEEAEEMRNYRMKVFY